MLPTTQLDTENQGIAQPCSSHRTPPGCLASPDAATAIPPRLLPCMFTLPYTSWTDLTGCGTPYSSRCFSWDWWWYPRCGQVPTFWINLLGAPMILAFLSFPEKQNCGGDEGNSLTLHGRRLGVCRSGPFERYLQRDFITAREVTSPGFPGQDKLLVCLFGSPLVYMFLSMGVKFRFYLNWN